MSGRRIPQVMRPHGFWGHVFGWVMDVFNGGAQDFALKRLDVQRNDAILEIGFGTGRLVRKLAAMAQNGFVGGVDPSDVMLRMAEKRTRAFRKDKRVDLKLGIVSALPWPDAHFDKAAALHSFQFWRDPVRDIAEVRRVLKPGGLLLLVLRTHDRSPPSWLPNAISRSGQEIGGVLQLLVNSGFRETRIEGSVGSSPVVTARKGA